MAMDLRQGLLDAWRQIATFVPKFVGFIVVLIIGWLVAKLLEKVVDKLLERVGFDRAVERSGVGRMLERTRYDASSLIARLVYYAVLLFTLQLGFGLFGPNPVSNLLAAVVGWLPKAIVAIIILVVAGAIARAVNDLVSGALGGTRYGRWLATAASVFIWALGIIAALNQMGIATTVTTPVLITVLATLGAILAIGLGGGLVRPMEQRWERWLRTAEAQTPEMKVQAEAYYRGRQDARQARAAEPQAGTAKSVPPE
ncbi:mechanosensitive ion channel family protein [Planotetraspora sp. GP83]|uniref:mechanosensitive ion channel family protein n=1 Tax=Planotetraspora sp. GP83 TaxID=3156264 RepID=UPI003516815E